MFAFFLSLWKIKEIENMSTEVKEERKSVKYDYNTNEYDKVLEPDEDFYRAISADEFLEKALVIVDKLDKIYLNK